MLYDKAAVSDNYMKALEKWQNTYRQTLGIKPVVVDPIQKQLTQEIKLPNVFTQSTVTR